MEGRKEGKRERGKEEREKERRREGKGAKGEGERKGYTTYHPRPTPLMSHIPSNFEMVGVT